MADNGTKAGPARAVRAALLLVREGQAKLLAAEALPIAAVRR